MMPPLSDPLTLDEHRELARELEAACVRLRALFSVVTDVYGPESRAAFSARRSVEWIEHLRREMQVQAERDHPGIVTGLYR